MRVVAKVCAALAAVAVTAHGSGSVDGGAAAADLCSYNFRNASFDLSFFRGTDYNIMDNRHNTDSSNYTYAFRVCGNVNMNSVPSECDKTYGNTPSRPESTGPSPAFQVAHPTSSWTPGQYDKCHRLGVDVNNGSEVWSLVNPSNPSKGVSLTYTGGDLCPDGSPRRLSVHFMCANDVKNIPDEETVLETSSCFYEVTVSTAFGCPRECPITDQKVCAGHGICEFDTARGKAKCFCNEGYKGKDCATKIEEGSSGLSSVSVVLILVSILAAVLLAFLIFLWLRIRSLRIDTTAYKSLTGGPDEQGDTAIYADE